MGESIDERVVLEVKHPDPVAKGKQLFVPDPEVKFTFTVLLKRLL